ncbi:MAG: competence protein ComEC, partial [Bauldia sp.]|nr:competence protein ComEC [Bauldia sp.]
VPVALALPIAMLAPRPDLIVDEDARAVAIRDIDGRLTILGGRGASFEIETWLRADADTRPANAADIQRGVACDALGCVGEAAGIGTVALVTRRDAFMEDCRVAAVVVSRLPAPPGCSLHALVIDRDKLDRYGAHAIYADGAGWRVETAYPDARRPFMPPRPAR